jgi:hypothetical protein
MDGTHRRDSGLVRRCQRFGRSIRRRKAALEAYLESLGGLGGLPNPQSGAIRGCTFPPSAVVPHARELKEAIRTVVTALLES